MRLELHNIGPIENISITLNKINVLIGPQSSGKSTIAKILSFCLWMEKDTVRNQSTDQINNEYIQEHLIAFYKLGSYFSEDSSIVFEGEVLEFSYESKSKVKVKTKEEFSNRKMGKVAYIPAERNVVSLSNIETLKMPGNYVSAFIFDWLTIHKKYSSISPVQFPSLHVEYYYDETKGDTLKLANEKEINLDVASSGLQAVVPLYTFVRYVTHWIYEHIEDQSFEDKDKVMGTFTDSLISDLKKSKDFRKINEETYKQFLSEILGNVLAHGGDLGLISKFKDLLDKITRPHYTSLIIEEPELNLFPETQVDLLYSILSSINAGRDKLLITTHSPYILYALNNVLMANKVKDEMDAESFNRLACSKVSLDSSAVSVWQVEDGHIIGRSGDNSTIQDEKGMVRKNFFDDSMKHIMSDFNNMVMYLDD